MVILYSFQKYQIIYISSFIIESKHIHCTPICIYYKFPCYKTHTLISSYIEFIDSIPLFFWFVPALAHVVL